MRILFQGWASKEQQPSLTVTLTSTGFGAGDQSRAATDEAETPGGRSEVKMGSCGLATTRCKPVSVRRRLAVLALVCLCTGSTRLAAGGDVSVRVSPRVAAAPAVVSITVVVERDGRNRSLVIEDDSATYYRRSFIQLDGERAARVHQLRLPGLPPGEHRIRASVYGTDGVETVSTSVTVVGFSGASE